MKYCTCLIFLLVFCNHFMYLFFNLNVLFVFIFLQVVALVNNGKGEFMASVRPKTTLCDGTFHKISGKMQSSPNLDLFPINISTCIDHFSFGCLAVIKRKNVVQLHVDTVDTYKIGPPSSTATLTKYPLYVGGAPGECLSTFQSVFTMWTKVLGHVCA